MADNLEPVDQEELEKAVYNLFEWGEEKKTAVNSRIPYGTLTKQLNPNDATESLAYQILMFCYGAEKTRAGLGDAIWAVLSRFRPRRQSTPPCGDELDAAWYYFKSVQSNHAARKATPEEYDAARDLLVETLGRVQTGARVMSQGEAQRVTTGMDG